MKLTLFIMALFILPAVYAQSPQENQSASKTDSIVPARKYDASKQHKNVPVRIHAIKKPLLVDQPSDINENFVERSNPPVADSIKANNIKPLTQASRSRKNENPSADPPQK